MRGSRACSTHACARARTHVCRRAGERFDAKVVAGAARVPGWQVFTWIVLLPARGGTAGARSCRIMQGSGMQRCTAACRTSAAAAVLHSLPLPPLRALPPPCRDDQEPAGCSGLPHLDLLHSVIRGGGRGGFFVWCQYNVKR